MKTYIFKTTATMKEYNRRKWWIAEDVVTEKRINAESLKAALDQFAAMVEKKHYITILILNGRRYKWGLCCW